TTSLDLWVSNADVGGNHSRIVFDEVCLAEITPTVNIGNFVWFDADGNGSVNGDESDYGLTSVTVELLSGGAPISSTTTAGGYYSFEGLAEGDYAVRIPSSNFGVSNPLADYTSSATDGGDPDNDIDNDDNGDGSGTATNIDSQAVTLAVDTEPMTTTIAGDTNYTVDFGFTAPLCADANDLGGTVFSDLNHDGINDTGSGTDATFYNSDIVVYAYDNDNAVVAQTTLRPDGSYLFDDIFTTNTHIRLEFTGLPDYLDVGYSGTGNGTATQKHQVGMCSADLGVLDAADYCQTNPSLATTCFLDNTGDGKALVSWPYNQRGVTPDPSGEALYSQIGTTWGLAYDRTHERIFSAAFLKRHSPLPDADTDNEGDLGAIYAISADTNTANDGTPLWLNLDGATDSGPNVIQVGSIGDNAARGISATPGVPSTDADAFDKVGKVGLGDIDFSGDGSILYAINLYQKTLHGIEINSAGSAGTIHTYTLPDPCNANPGENGGDPYDDTDMRPFALDYHHGDLYVGLVCSGEYSGDPADLRGYVYRFVDSTNTFDSTPVLDFALTYRREHAANHGDCDVDYREWLAWTSTWPASCAINGRIVYPQPMLTDIEFTSDGNLTIGLLDRTGNQGGELNADLTGNMNNGDNTDGFRVNASGDILHATPDYDGTFTIETTWTDDIASTEFYTGDEFIEENGVVNHREIALGALAYLPNSTEIASTGWDAVNKAEGGTFNTGGIFFSYIEDGTRDLIGQSYNVFTNTSNIPGTFGKAAGLGDLELLCERAPIEIGNYIWQDDDGDGIQDPCENGLADIDVTLYSITGTVVATTTTNTSGEYYFDEADGLAPQTTYRVCVPFDDTDLNGATITTQDYASNANHATSGISTDVHDSDGDNGVILAGHSCVQITTGNAGDNDYTIDFGFEPTPPSVAVEKIRNTPDPVLPGAIVTFTIRITNTGTTTITTLPLTDTYSSAYLTFIDIRTIPDADTTADTGQILWGDLTQAAPNGFGMDLGPGNHFDVIVEFVAALDTSALPNTWTINTAQVYTHTVTDTVRIYNPTNVVLTNRDVSVEEGQVVLSWSTVDENDLVGFHVLRLDEASGEPVRLTSDEQIILAQGAANGADYRFEDAAGNVDAEHHYVLEMVMADGTRPIVDMGTVNQGPSVWTVYLPVLRK
ncbi:MAG: SdrD B-like domain-containing protein, partial [Chloroflexota bacterium]